MLHAERLPWRGFAGVLVAGLALTYAGANRLLRSRSLPPESVARGIDLGPPPELREPPLTGEVPAIGAPWSGADAPDVGGPISGDKRIATSARVPNTPSIFDDEDQFDDHPVQDREVISRSSFDDDDRIGRHPGE